MKNVYEVSNFLLPNELAIIEELFATKQKQSIDPDSMLDPSLGRIIYMIPIPINILKDIQIRVEALLGRPLKDMNAMFVDYDSKYGQPNLPPHFDGDQNDVIVDYQYKSNTSWGLGVSSTVYEMEDNKAIIFNPNEYPHWRPHKTFQKGEYITMMFFRFPDESIDYSHMRLTQNHPIFEEARKIRDNS